MKRTWPALALPLLLLNLACDTTKLKEVSDTVSLVDSIRQEVESQDLSKITERISKTSPEEMQRVLDSAGIDAEKTRQQVEEIARRVEQVSPGIAQEARDLSEKVGRGINRAAIDSAFAQAARPKTDAPSTTAQTDTTSVTDQVQDIANRVLNSLGSKKQTQEPTVPPEPNTEEERSNPVLPRDAEPPREEPKITSSRPQQPDSYDPSFHTIDRTPYTMQLDITQTRDTDVEARLRSLAQQYGGEVYYYAQNQTDGQQQIQAMLSVPYRDHLGLISDLQREIGEVNHQTQPHLAENQQPDLAKIELRILRPITKEITETTEKTSWVQGLLNVLGFLWPVILLGLLAGVGYYIYLIKKKERLAREEAARLEAERLEQLRQEEVRREAERLELERLRQQAHYPPVNPNPNPYQNPYQQPSPDQAQGYPSEAPPYPSPNPDPYDAYRPKENTDENPDRPSPFPMNPRD